MNKLIILLYEVFVFQCFLCANVNLQKCWYWGIGVYRYRGFFVRIFFHPFRRSVNAIFYPAIYRQTHDDKTPFEALILESIPPTSKHIVVYAWQ